jgi:phospholipase C
MNLNSSVSFLANGLRLGLTSLALFQFAIGAPIANAQTPGAGSTATPIKHVIVIIGENRSFDHVFATYQPRKGETVNNLLSEGIVNADGTPGPNFSKAQQLAASDTGTDPFLLSPPTSLFPNDQLPAPLVGGPKVSYIPNVCSATTPITKCAGSLTLAQQSEKYGLPENFYPLLLSGGSGQASHTPDMRISNVNALPAGPFQLTNGTTFVYDDYAASPVHRFYQMWQQMDCSAVHITASNASGCNNSLWSWVEVTVGAGTNGATQPSNFSTEYSPTASTTGEGSTSLGFYNVQQGDARYFKFLADSFAMSDNFHQSVQGGTGANHIMLGHGDAIWFSDGNGNAMQPPHNAEVYPGTADAGKVDEIENPNPAPGTNNWYAEDGYGGGGFGSAVSGGGSYSLCADPSQPGVGPIAAYLKSLPHPLSPHCEANHYYLLNNYNPGYFGNGANAYIDHNVNNTPFTIPPSSVKSIGDSLIAANISWKYYGDQWNNYKNDPYQLNYGTAGPTADEYCNICNPFQYDTSIMANDAVREAHIQDIGNLYNDITTGSLPAVSFVKPSGYVDGHPSSSKLDLFEGFAQKIVEAVQANPSVWKDTAIFITFDEGGGYYDSGYVQALDFFGDGTRIPLMVVSPYTTPGHISHEYADHVSILKFIERNWSLAPVTGRSRDNYPNPIVSDSNPYVPLNTPALGDLFDLFTFPAK